MIHCTIHLPLTLCVYVLFFYVVLVNDNFQSYLTAVTKTRKINRRPRERKRVSETPLNIVILWHKTNDLNWTCVATFALLQQDIKKWFVHPCDSQTRIDFVIHQRSEVPVLLCADNHL